MKKTPLSPEQFIDLIDEFYVDAALEGVSRFEPKWGIWSRQMNLEINTRVKLEDPDAFQLKYVTVYWVLKSQMLELVRKDGLMARFQEKKLAIEADKIKEMIKTGIVGDSMKPLSLDDLAVMVLGGTDVHNN